MRKKNSQIWTIPNVLSLLRLMMIPLFVWLYLQGYKEWTAYILFLSGVTDVIDGYVARHFHQITEFGKVLDPVADKLTQAAMLLCLNKAFPLMMVPFILLVVKEACAGISGLMVINRAGVVLGAEWHGKLTTFLLYGIMILHVVWKEIPV